LGEVVLLFPKVVWGDVWFDTETGYYHLQAAYDRKNRIIILDWQRVESAKDMFLNLLLEVPHHIIDLLKLPEKFHDLIDLIDRLLPFLGEFQLTFYCPFFPLSLWVKCMEKTVYRRRYAEAKWNHDKYMKELTRAKSLREVEYIYRNYKSQHIYMLRKVAEDEKLGRITPSEYEWLVGDIVAFGSEFKSEAISKAEEIITAI